MAGIRKLRKIQLGRETTAGTNVSASTIWRGTGVIDDNLEVIFVEEDVGYKSGVDRTMIPKVEAMLELEETPATFEQLPHILDMGVEAATASADGSGSAYIYNYPFAENTDTQTVKSYSIEGGDNTQEEEFSYGFCTGFNLSGAAGEAVTMSATVVGRQVSADTFSSTATLPTVEEVLFSKGKLYIDDSDGAFGGTQKTSTFRDFNLEVDTGWRAVYTGDGELYFTFLKNVGAEITLDITFEHDSTAVAEIANWRAETARLIRLDFLGSTVTTAGTSYGTKALRIDLAGKWESFEPLDDTDGNDTVTGTFRSRYNSTASEFAIIRVANLLASLP